MAQGARRPARHTRQASRFATLVGRGEKPDQQHGPARKAPDEATVSYIKRTLCKRLNATGSSADAADDIDSKPLEDLLPPLTSSNEVDVQLYALIAVVLNLFVQSWYNKITPDQNFVANVVQIIAHCTRGLEQRLRNVDMEHLVFEELPGVLTEHVNAVRIASRGVQHPNFQSTNRILYHHLRPHHALSPVPNSPEQLADQQENETAWCQMVVNRALSLLLPQEEHQNPCLQVLVSEILSEMIFHNGICGKACEGWLIWEGITKVIYAIRPDLVPPAPDADQPQGDRLAQFGLLSEKGNSTDISSQQSEYNRLERLSTTFWTLIQSAWLVWLLLRSWVTALMHASSLPARSGRQQDAKVEDFSSQVIAGEKAGWSSRDLHHSSSDAHKVPILGMRIWTCLSTITRLQERMPWLTGVLSLMQWLLLVGPGQLCCTDSRLDRLLSQTLRARALSPTHLAPALHAARAALFPSNALGAPRCPPDAAEAAAIRRECARAIVGVIPPVVRRVLFATEDLEGMEREVEGELEVLFADAWVNRGLVVEVVEVVFCRLFPEVLE